VGFLGCDRFKNVRLGNEVYLVFYLRGALEPVSFAMWCRSLSTWRDLATVRAPTGALSQSRGGRARVAWWYSANVDAVGLVSGSMTAEQWGFGRRWSVSKLRGRLWV
jgi:hypothetical protein